MTPASIELEAGGTAQVSVTVQNARPDVQFSSSDNAVATVSSGGTVTGVAAGSAVITATSVADAKAHASAVVTVRNPVLVTITTPAPSVNAGLSVQLAAVVTGTTNSAVKWTTSNDAVATVSTSGVVGGVSAGVAVISAASVADPAKSSSITVTVTPPVAVSIIAPQAALTVGQTAVLSATVSGNLNTAVTWRSSATGVVTITGAGLVNAVGPGTATITATSAADPSKTASVLLNVSPPVAVTFTSAPATLLVGQAAAFVASVSGTSNAALIWKSSASSVAVVNQAGMVTAVAPGSTTITAISVADSSKSASATLTVNESVSVAITSGPGTLTIGETAQFAASVSGTFNTAVAWQSSDAAVAIIDAGGRVTGIGAGSAVITATAIADQTKSATATINVGAAHLPDLVVDATTAPPTGIVGSSIAASATIRNAGTAAAGAFQIGFYYSTDASITAADIYSGTGCTVQELSPGSKTECTGSIAVPLTLPPGLYFVGAVADNTGAVAEITEDNNSRASAATTRMISINAPDFVIDEVTAGATAVPGGELAVTSRIRNIGLPTKAAFRIVFYFSTDNNITTSDVFSGAGCIFESGLATNVTGTCDGRLEVPATLPAGTYYVGAIVDDIGAVPELDDGNNARAPNATTLIGIPQSGPDLVVDSVKAADSGTAGSGLMVSATVSNKGAATTHSFRLRFYFSTDLNITTADFPSGFGCTYPGGLPAGTSRDCSGEITIPATLNRGHYFVGAIADDGAEIIESNETNNGRASTTATDVSPTVITLVVTPAPTNIETGTSLQLTATVTGTTNKAVKWRSSAPTIASISPTGVLTAHFPGSFFITATAVADPGADVQLPMRSSAPFAMNFKLEKAYITQAVQTHAGDMPLVAGRPGLLRAFVQGPNRFPELPIVRVRIYNNNALLRTVDAPPPQVLPFDNAEDSLHNTWNVPIPASQIQPGLRVIIDVDPDSLYNLNAFTKETTRADNTIEIKPVVVSLPELKARFVPVKQSFNGLVGDVSNGNRDSYLSSAYRMHPIGSYAVDVRNVYTTTTQLGADYSVGWATVLSELNALRVAEDPTSYYYGVIRPAYRFGGTGLGYLGMPTAMGVDWEDLRAATVAHEWGHNFNRLHSPCGDPAGPDPRYPYPDGIIGTWGYDIMGGSIQPPTYTDVMGYCDVGTQWVSDFTYRGVLSWRASLPLAGPSAVAEPSLVIWGRITPRGVILEPAFETVTQASMPEGFGQYLLQGFDANGETLFSYAVDGSRVADGPDGERQFAYAIPLRLIPAQRLERLRLAGGSAAAEVRSGTGTGAAGLAALNTASASIMAVRSGDAVNLTWDNRAFPMIVVRNAETSEILSFARGGMVSVATADRRLVLQLTDGVRSTALRVDVN